MPGAPATGVAPAAERERFPRSETCEKLGLDGLRSGRHSTCGSVVCVRDIALTDGAAARREPSAREVPASGAPALDTTGVIPTRTGARRAQLGRESLADALRSYCEESEE